MKVHQIMVITHINHYRQCKNVLHLMKVNLIYLKNVKINIFNQKKKLLT
jgi:hypothetical protein